MTQKDVSPPTHYNNFPLAAIFLLAAALRLFNLGGKSLWLDEAFTVQHAAQSLAIIWATVREPHPPLYYTFMHVWLALGRSEAVVRLPSMFISLANLGLLYALGRRLFGRRVALAAVALLAVSPLDLWYAQEARMYIFVAFAGLLMALGLAIASLPEVPNFRQGLGGGLVLFLGLALGLYLDYITIPLWAGLSALWFVWWWRRGRPTVPFLAWLLPSLLAWLAYLPWWSYFYAILERLSTIYLFANLRRVLNLPALPAGAFLGLLALAAGATAVGGHLALSLLQRRQSHRWLAPLLMGAFLLVTALTPFPRLYSLKRVVVTGWPFVVLLVAWLASRPRAPRRHVGNVTYGYGLILLVSLAATLVSLLAVPKDDWRGLTTYLDTAVAPGEVVWVEPFWNVIAYDYYQPAHPAVGVQEVAAALEATAGAETIWLVVEKPPVEDQYRPAQPWLDQGWRLVAVVPFYRLELRQYQKDKE